MGLSSREYRENFLTSAEADAIRDQLQAMVDDAGYTTKTFYTTDDNDQSFVTKHITYLSEHPKLKASEYLSNLRLMTKRR